MKEFTTAVEEVAAEDDYTAKIKALLDSGKTQDEAEAEVDSELGILSFKIDGRVLKAYPPNDGQLAFMLAALGRGQAQASRFASIINLMMSALRSDDADYFEGRLLSTDPKTRLRIGKIEEVFEYLVGEWFGGGEGTDRPTPPSSGSAESQPSDGQNSTTTTGSSPADSSASVLTDS